MAKGLKSNEDKKSKPIDTVRSNFHFLTDVEELRTRARKNIESGPVTPSYKCDLRTTIDLLQIVVATELVCVLRYSMNAIAATGISSEGVRGEFLEHAEAERKHMLAAAQRISQLGGIPNLNPDSIKSRSATEYVEGTNLIEMIKENLVAERVVIEHYRELIRFFNDDDPTTRIMLERILAEEEDHADEMHDLLVAYEGRPLLDS